MTLYAAALRKRIDIAAGTLPADIVVSGGEVFNLYAGTIERRDLLIAGDRIAALVEPGSATVGESTRVIDASGAYVMPTLIDSHFHIGGTHLSVGQLAKALLAVGTSCIATDLYEIYTVSGLAGVRSALDEAASAGLRILYLAPVHLLGLESIGSFKWNVTAQDFSEMLDWPETVGIMEPAANFVLQKHDQILEIIGKAQHLGKVFAGHAPGLSGNMLQAYISLGASSDHESKRIGEVTEKLRLGMAAMLRNGSAAPDLPDLIGAPADYPELFRWMMMCSDEVDPHDLLTRGHMNGNVRLAIKAGIPPVAALQMASLNVAEYYNLSADLGVIAPGKKADFMVVESLETMSPKNVVVNGVVLDEASSSDARATGARPANLAMSEVNIHKVVEPADFMIPSDAEEGDIIAVRVIEVENGSLISKSAVENLTSRGGHIRFDVDADVIPLAILDRNQGSGRIANGFVKGMGIKNGAVASTYCHPYHNLAVLGDSLEDMALAANTVKGIGGGIVVVQDGKVAEVWELPIAGVMSEEPLEDAAASFERINGAIKALGSPMDSPVLSISFVALPTIPALGMTDKGLFDVESGTFLSVVVDKA